MNTNLNHFWNWIRNDAGERILRLDGPVDEDSFWGDEVTPKAFRDELEAEDGDVTVWINSPGGNVLAAAEIYNMLCDHKGSITVKIDAIAASAASVIAMAGDRILMSPVAMLMIHDPMTIAMGNTKDMERAIATLNEVKESIINAYVKKTGLTRNKVSKLMSDETWMNAKKAVELGFADEILFTGMKEPIQEGEDDGKEMQTEGRLYSARHMSETILNRICPAESEAPVTDPDETEDVEPPEGGVNPEPPEDAMPPADTLERPARENSMPVIGLDGKTSDGSMPYQILKDKLDFLR
ncbi:MAG: Clp protease ClpP [Lachnospiraceae bacterium]|nr:Clp protease ClpP [Lachnospiraceae bacterium]